MKKIIYISDYFIEHILGGAEISDSVLLTEILEVDVERIQSHMVSLDFLKKNTNNLFIISNFIHLTKNCEEYIQNNCNYVIYEHDHKYLISRNPGLFKNFKAPASEIVHLDFYTNALKVIAQSNFHKEIIEKNLSIENVFSLGGNLWPLDTLKNIKLINKNSKTNNIAILDSDIDHKNTPGAAQYCKVKKLDFILIKDQNYNQFINKLNKCSTLLFLPKTPETLSRVVVEARMLGLKTITSNNIGAVHEPWFNLKGDELVDVMQEKKKEIFNKFNEIINE